MIKYLLSVLIFISLNVRSNDLLRPNSTSSSVISGTIVDQISGEGLAGVIVMIQGTDLKTYTDFDGNFTFKDIAPGEYTIVAEYVSYKKRTVRGVRPGILLNTIRLRGESGSGLTEVKKVSFAT